MRVSLNLIKKYVDLSDISDEKIATDLTLKTVEVEKIENKIPSLRREFYCVYISSIQKSRSKSRSCTYSKWRIDT